MRELLSPAVAAALRVVLKQALGILAAAKVAGRIILLSPTPRYIIAKCCGDAEHITNFGDTYYRNII